MRLAAVTSLAVSGSIALLGTMFSDVLMSACAFGPEMDRPLAHALALLRAEGPRIPLLDSHGVPAAAQAALLAGLAAATVAAVWPRRVAAPADGATQRVADAAGEPSR